jgi:hypothetical protein
MAHIIRTPAITMLSAITNRRSFLTRNSTKPSSSLPRSPVSFRLPKLRALLLAQDDRFAYRI